MSICIGKRNGLEVGLAGQLHSGGNKMETITAKDHAKPLCKTQVKTRRCNHIAFLHFLRKRKDI